MSERPIIFSAPMVRALLDGRKTQTRRVLKPQPEQTSTGWWHLAGKGGGCFCDQEADVSKLAVDYVPYAAGDRLWVREAWRAPSMNDHLSPSDLPRGCAREFEADEEQVIGWGDDTAPYPIGSAGKLRSSIHMPRWASRLTLEVTDVRVQRLQDISREDVIAEGLTERDGAPVVDCHAGWHEPFAALWDSIHGPGAWDANPWVAAITFRVEPLPTARGRR